eukprot:6490475-Amphidinium_carterae.1
MHLIRPKREPTTTAQHDSASLCVLPERITRGRNSGQVGVLIVIALQPELSSFILSPADHPGPACRCIMSVLMGRQARRRRLVQIDCQILLIALPCTSNLSQHTQGGEPR